MEVLHSEVKINVMVERGCMLGKQRRPRTCERYGRHACFIRYEANQGVRKKVGALGKRLCAQC